MLKCYCHFPSSDVTCSHFTANSEIVFSHVHCADDFAKLDAFLGQHIGPYFKDLSTSSKASAVRACLNPLLLV